MSQTPVWFITGCSSGFGFSLARHALSFKHHVIATSRSPERNPELVSEIECLGGVWYALDVAAPEADLAKSIEKATAVYGRIDILVNCAAYALIGAFETFTDEECRAQMDTNFFGPMSLTRLVLPAMRARKSGTIIQFSSTAGLEARPTRSMYSGSKFALEAASEALSAEVAPFNIRVLIVSPGWFQSNFASAATQPKKALPEEYKSTVVGQMTQYMEKMAQSKAPGDVEKGVAAIFDVVMKRGIAEGMEEFLRLPLGKDGAARWEVKMADLKANLDGTEMIWRSTDADA